MNLKFKIMFVLTCWTTLCPASTLCPVVTWAPVYRRSPPRPIVIDSLSTPATTQRGRVSLTNNYNIDFLLLIKHVKYLHTPNDRMYSTHYRHMFPEALYIYKYFDFFWFLYDFFFFFFGYILNTTFWFLHENHYF